VTKNEMMVISPSYKYCFFYRRGRPWHDYIS